MVRTFQALERPWLEKERHFLFYKNVCGGGDISAQILYETYFENSKVIYT